MKLIVAIAIAAATAVYLLIPPTHSISEDDWACTGRRAERLIFFAEITRTHCVQWTRKERP